MAAVKTEMRVWYSLREVSLCLGECVELFFEQVLADAHAVVEQVLLPVEGLHVEVELLPKRTTATCLSSQTFNTPSDYLEIHASESPSTITDNTYELQQLGLLFGLPDSFY